MRKLILLLLLPFAVSAQTVTPNWSVFGAGSHTVTMGFPGQTGGRKSFIDSVNLYSRFLKKADSALYVTRYYLDHIGDFIRNSDFSIAQHANAYLDGSGVYLAGNASGQYSALYNLGLVGSTGSNQFAFSANYIDFQRSGVHHFKLFNDTINNKTIISGDSIRIIPTIRSSGNDGDPETLVRNMDIDSAAHSLVFNEGLTPSPDGAQLGGSITTNRSIAIYPGSSLALTDAFYSKSGLNYSIDNYGDGILDLHSGSGLSPGTHHAQLLLGIDVGDIYAWSLLGTQNNYSTKTGFIHSGLGVIVWDSRSSLGQRYQADYSTVGKTYDRWIPDWGAVKSKVDSLNTVTKIPAVGTIYDAPTITSTSDWSNNGLSAMSASGGKLTITGTNTTSTDFTASADLTAPGTTCFDKWTITAAFTAPTPSATTGILWFGMRSNNTTASVFNVPAFGIDISNTGTQGTLYLRGGTGGVFLYATSATKLTIAANDVIKIICTRSLWNFTARIMDITNPQADVTINYISTGPLISSMQNAGLFTVFTQTATPISINSYNVYSSDRKNPDIVLVGNSKTMGKAATQYGTTLSGLLGAHFSVVNPSGGGDGTAEILRQLPSLLALKGKVYILDAPGRNDIAAGVSLATTEANIASAISQIQAIGAQVILNTGYYETTVSQSALQAWAIANYPSITIDNLAATSADLSSMYTDNIHTTDVGFAITYSLDVAAITTDGSFDLTSVNNKLSELAASLSPITSSQTANTFQAAPDGSAGIPSFRTIAKGDVRNIFKTEGTGGTLDWNDATNNLPGVGPTLLAGTATNGMGGSAFYYVFNISHVGTAATNNHTQYAYPYNGNIVWYRTYFSSAFGSWHQIVDADDAQTLTSKTLTSPVLTTPTLGVATATSINKVAITAPATSATLTIANGKTLTANNSITFAGTDATTMTFPTTSATIARTDAANTFTGVQTMTAPVFTDGGGVTAAASFGTGSGANFAGFSSNRAMVGYNNSTNNVSITAGSAKGFEIWVNSTGGSFGAGTNALTISSAGNTTLTGNLTLGTAGNKINITTGSNASIGTATLVGGTVTVSTTAVTASSKIFLTDATTGALTNIGTPTVGTIVAGTSFVINSSNVLDTSNVNWFIIN